jgi:hypothetical protein
MVKVIATKDFRYARVQRVAGEEFEIEDRYLRSLGKVGKVRPVEPQEKKRGPGRPRKEVTE